MKFVIGDVHGEITKLASLVDIINKFDAHAFFVFIGDYIDKGENSRTTLAYLTSLSGVKPCCFLMGNHEYCWINLYNKAKDFQTYLLKFGALNTMQSFGCSNISVTRQAMLDEFQFFFNSLKPFYQTGSFLITHSGIDPVHFHTPIGDISIQDFLFNRYKFISSHGLFRDEMRFIFGHTGFFKPYVDDFKIGIDTAACFLPEQPLTAFCLDENIFINSNGVVEDCAVQADHCPNIVRMRPWRTID
jgi:serine/threonine protein phosphatase 1